MKSWTTTAQAPALAPAPAPIQEANKTPITVTDAPPPPETEVEGHDQGLQDSKEDGEVKREPLWGPCECCISCVSRSFISGLKEELNLLLAGDRVFP